MVIKNKIVGIISIAALFLPAVVFAHPGNTASDGCHYCRTNCTKWGVAWNQRHCHNAKPIIVPKTTPKLAPKAIPKPTPRMTPKKTPKTTPTPSKSAAVNTTEIKNEINRAKSDYQKNPYLFREKLIDKLAAQFKTSKSVISPLVYSLLADTKN